MAARPMLCYIFPDPISGGRLPGYIILDESKCTYKLLEARNGVTPMLFSSGVTYTFDENGLFSINVPVTSSFTCFDTTEDPADSAWPIHILSDDYDGFLYSFGCTFDNLSYIDNYTGTLPPVKPHYVVDKSSASTKVDNIYIVPLVHSTPVCYLDDCFYSVLFSTCGTFDGCLDANRTIISFGAAGSAPIKKLCIFTHIKRDYTVSVCYAAYDRTSHYPADKIFSDAALTTPVVLPSPIEACVKNPQIYIKGYREDTPKGTADMCTVYFSDHSTLGFNIVDGKPKYTVPGGENVDAFLGDYEIIPINAEPVILPPPIELASANFYKMYCDAVAKAIDVSYGVISLATGPGQPVKHKLLFHNDADGNGYYALDAKYLTKLDRIMATTSLNETSTYIKSDRLAILPPPIDALGNDWAAVVPSYCAE